MEIVLTIFGYNLTYLELIGSVFTFISVILATKANLWNWVSSIVSQICFFFLFWYNGLYANAILQIFFTYICLISIFRWDKTDDKEDKGIIWMSNRQRIEMIVKMIFFIIVGWFTLSNIDQFFPTLKSENPFLDIVITVLSIDGILLLSKKYIEAWIIWIIVDFVCIILFFYTGMFVIGLEYILITGIAIYGLFNWIKIKNNLT